MINREFGKSADITEKVVRYAMENTDSNAQAASFLSVSYNTYKKYAKSYLDEETGLTLFELHKNQAGIGIHKGSFRPKGYAKLKEVLAGLHPDYPPQRLRKRVNYMIREAILQEKCARCGFEERRILDYSMPLLLDWIDGDSTNHKRDNLQLLCYNCYYLTVDNIIGKRIDFL